MSTLKALTVDEIIARLSALPEEVRKKEFTVMNLPLIGACTIGTSEQRKFLKGQQVSNVGLVDLTPFIVISQKEPTM